MTIESNLVTVVALDDNVKALLTSMKFVSSFPEEAKAIAFYEDGNAQFWMAHRAFLTSCFRVK